ncbi:MAG: hypothetical protein GY869_02180, partial [Planctomycetes bacterium]|nr:hypothetical protein [Planctomycetota bacterium]
IPASALEDRKDEAASTDSGDLYFGQQPPGNKAEIFAPEVLQYETHDSPIISRDETWILVGGIIDASGETTKFYQMIDGHLSLTPNPLTFDIPEICNGIAVSPTENRIYIQDWRNGDDLFYFLEKIEGGWTAPISLGEEINAIETHWQFSVAANENLYFISRGQGIIVAIFDGDAHLKPVLLKLEDGHNIRGGTPFIFPDESYLIFSMDKDLHISYNLNNGTWTAPQNLGPDINSDYLDNCPKISPGGKYLFFVSRRIGMNFVTYWADAAFVEELKPKRLK